LLPQGSMDSVSVAAYQPRYLAPYSLPAQAVSDVKKWNLAHKVVVFRLIEVLSDMLCQNCQGDGGLYVSFLGKGPFQSASPRKICAWLDPGWYEVEQTLRYVCPVCAGLGQEVKHD